jgi:DUF917 family protein
VSGTRISIGPAELDDYAFGCAAFGTGGGGDVTPSVIATRAALQRYGAVDLVHLEDLDEDALVVPLSSIGAPTVSTEMLGSGAESVRIRDLIERRTGVEIGAVMATEIGGANGVDPVRWAAELGVPLLDADGMGRAFPELPMVSMNVANVPPGAVTVADALGNVGVVEPINPDWAERWTRALCVASGSTAVIADYVMTASQAHGAVIERTVSRALELGKRVRGADDPVAELVTALAAVHVVNGKIADIERTTMAGFVRGTITVLGLGQDAGREISITVQNECLVMRDGDNVVATVPDLIGLFDAAHGEPVPIESVTFGQRVAVLAWPCDPLWRTERALKIAGPTAFGLDLDYRSLAAPRA